MQVTQLSGGRGWLNAPAAASLERYEQDHGEQPVTSAGRSEAEQQSLIDRWDQGGVYNRPPYLYEPKRPAWAGTHVSGNALDVSNHREFAANAAAYGWWQPYSWDVVHFEYDPARDQHINEAPPAAPGAESPPMEDDVTIIYCTQNAKKETRTVVANGGLFWIIPNNGIVSGPVVWLTDVVLGALIEDVRKSKSRGAPPVLIHNVDQGQWLYAAHGGVVLLRGDEERANIEKALKPATIRVGKDLAALIVKNIREGRDG